MPRILIDDIPYISYDASPNKRYWQSLSTHLISKHGTGPFRDPPKVESILIDGFQFLVNEFNSLILAEKNLKFFLYVFWLHESSIKLYIKSHPTYELPGITEGEFSRYRRILKLILEQGCDIDLEWAKWPNASELEAMDMKIQDLLYLGSWLYEFAQFIAFQKMIKECYYITYRDNSWLTIDWQYHYGQAYDEIMPKLSKEYVNSMTDDKVVVELKAAINSCFAIEYDFAVGQIFKIKERLNPKDPSLQTIQPHILPLNLTTAFNINMVDAEAFYAGLTISRKNKLSLEESVYHPYSMDRYLFRPILIYNIGGEERALIGWEKFAESIMVLATNALQWNAMQKEWIEIPCMESFVNRKGMEHDKLLEDRIEEILKKNGLLYLRNVKSFMRQGQNRMRIDNALAGEIDFIVVSHTEKKVIVAEAKYNRSRYEAIGYRNDYTNFINDYEPKLERKVSWLKNNLKILEDHFKLLFPHGHLSILNYEVEGVFFINTPTFYMLNGNFKTIHLRRIEDYLTGRFHYPIYHFTNEKGEISIVHHPYFRKPIILNTDI